MAKMCLHLIFLLFIPGTEDEINNYFKLNPRFGSLGHVVTEDEHKLFVEKGAGEHTIDTEIEDTLIMGEMKKYLKISL